MSEADERARQALDALIRERREEFAVLSRLLGRNPAYVQQYIKRGVPRRLQEADRRTLARYFGVDEVLLGALPSETTPSAPEREADAFSAHEVLHTAMIIGDLFERQICQHKWTRSDPDLAAAAFEIGEKLADFYQLAGAKSF